MADFVQKIVNRAAGPVTSPARVLLVGPLDCHDLRDPDGVLLVLNGVGDGEGSADMEAVDCGGMGAFKFFLVSSQKGVLREALDLFDDDAPRFWGEPF